ncbi:MAG: DUF4956 domain-containing protein [Bacteroidota bacterium]|jgi:hypothetical protein|nr:DUF4956 domain-containing protein [Bacteroidota bacterium]MEC8759599.1 DUF4956 domain-containing protein [Bacteroidota bacterium]
MTEIALHFAANLISCWIIVRMIYQSKAKRRDFVFTFTMVSASVFLLCRMLSGVELDLAFALGLFAIFGIIRYRTNPVPIREMTYLFLVIAMAVMNALAPMSMDLLDVAMGNGLLWAIAFILERLLFVEHLVTKRVVYDRIELLQEGRREELRKDLGERIGEKVERMEIGNVDLLRETAVIKVSYRGDDHSEHIDPTDSL